MSKFILHKAHSRGISSNGWIYTKHSFCFADYYDPDRIHFGVLRSVNDVTIAPGRGLEKHAHSDMEMVMLTMKGDVIHSDSLGNKVELSQGSVQTITSGSGYLHEELNKNNDESLKFIHIWIFPYKKNLKPHYSYKQFKLGSSKNELLLLASPHAEDNVTLIQQDAWVHICNLNADHSVQYELKKKGNGIYIINTLGECLIEDQLIETEDGIGIWDTEKVNIKALKDSQIIVVEVPLKAYEA